ncbi:MAG: hypothetical protein WC489_05340 [Patescibacteria group bacterium]
MMPLIKKYNTPENKELEKKGIYYQNWQLAREDLIRNLNKDGIISYQQKQLDLLDEYYHKKLLYITLDNYPKYIQMVKNKAKHRKETYFLQSGIHYSQKEYFLPDIHFNKLGHQKMMEEIIYFFLDNNLIPCLTFS